MRRLRLPALFLLLLLAACAPRLQPPGLESVEPQLNGDHFVADDGVTLPVRVWLPDGTPTAVILALHGFNDYSKAFDAPARRWAAAGIATYAFDQRGFGATRYQGLWPGEQRMIADLREMAQLLRVRHPATPFYLLGESMGAAVVMAAATADDPPTADGLTLVAPAVWGRETQGPLQSGVLWLAAHTVPWMKLTGEGLDIHPTDNVEVLRAMVRDPLVIKKTRIDAVFGLVDLMDLAYAAAPNLPQGTLVLYGSREDVIPDEAVLAMLRRLPADAARRPRIAIYPDGYHMLLRDLHADLVLDDVAAWIADPAVPLPSGGDALAESVLRGGGDTLKAAATD
jgi:alpha-beta hydrolase superfamily lysophospholipase